MSDAYLLVSHGSRDPRSQLAIDHLAAQLRLHLESIAPLKSPILLSTAQLELAAQPLHFQISDFAHKCTASGITRIVMLPLFLIPGVHVMADIPAEIALATPTLEPLCELVCLPFLGAHPTLTNLFEVNR